MNMYLWVVGLVVYGVLGLLLLYLVWRSPKYEIPSLWTYRVGNNLSSLIFMDRISVELFLGRRKISNAVVVQISDGTRFDKMVTCEECKGTGGTGKWVSGYGSGEQECDKCNGSGRIKPKAIRVMIE